MSVSYLIGNSGQRLILSASVLKHFDSWRQTKSEMPEAGGQLFGKSDETEVVIHHATGPRFSDRRGRFFYIADRWAEKREIKTMHRCGLHYFGDWHTHPEAVPVPSCSDLTTISDLFSCSTHSLNAFVMIIVGREFFPAGLHVSLHEEGAWAKLYSE